MASQFGVEDLIASLGITGLDDFELQDGGDDINSRYAERPNRLGDILEEQAIDPRIDYNLSLVIKSVPVDDVELILGGEGYEVSTVFFVLTSLRLRQEAEDFPVLSLTGHIHTGSGVGSHVGSAYTIALPTLNEGVNAVLSASGSLNEDITSVELSASVNHRDRYSRNTGIMLIGRSTRCRLEERITHFQNASLSIASGWKLDSNAGSGANEAFKTRLWVAHKYQAPDVEA